LDLDPDEYSSPKIKESPPDHRPPEEFLLPSPFGNAFMKAILLSPLHAMMGDELAVIAVTGRKTGRRISTPVNVSPWDGEYLVLSTRTRTWWRNLQAGRQGELHYRGKDFLVLARVLDRASGVLPVLKTYFEAHPGREKYFGIRTDPGGRCLEEDLRKAAEERVVVFLKPLPSG
jgi:hypothetical protein